MKVCVLGSGSSGNCVYVANANSALLLDAGFSGKEILSRLRGAGLNAGLIQAIVVSHEHSDHVKGVGVMARTLNVPVYMNDCTYKKSAHVIGNAPEIRSFDAGADFEAAGLWVSPFSIPHDAADPCAFVFSDGRSRAAVLTDAGAPTLLMEEKMRGADYIVIESNHDPAMLMAGPYPWELKQRIASRLGHLSNEACAGLLGKAVHAGLQGVTFAHVSRTNNNQDLVRLTAEETLSAFRTSYEIAGQDAPGEVFHIE